ncbi:MAG: hypothetical protein ACO38A_03510 [Ilumatobacteraceae bacterium]
MSPTTGGSPNRHHPSPVERMLAGIDPDDVPTAGVDPIDSRGEAIAALSLVIGRPLRAETVVLTLDRWRRGVGMVAIDGTDDERSIEAIGEHLDTVITLAESAQHALGLSRHPTEQIVVATIDPTGSVMPGSGHLLDVSCAVAGVTLLDWLVLGPDTVTPMVDDRWPRHVGAAPPG